MSSAASERRKPTKLVAAALAVALAFALGMLLGRRSPEPSDSARPAASPRLLLDTSGLELLPDASLELGPIAPPVLDAAPPPERRAPR